MLYYVIVPLLYYRVTINIGVTKCFSVSTHTYHIPQFVSVESLMHCGWQKSCSSSVSRKSFQSGVIRVHFDRRRDSPIRFIIIEPCKLHEYMQVVQSGPLCSAKSMRWSRGRRTLGGGGKGTRSSRTNEDPSLGRGFACPPGCP